MSKRWFGAEKSLVKVDQGGCTQNDIVQWISAQEWLAADYQLYNHFKEKFQQAVSRYSNPWLVSYPQLWPGAAGEGHRQAGGAEQGAEGGVRARGRRQLQAGQGVQVGRKTVIALKILNLGLPCPWSKAIMLTRRSLGVPLMLGVNQPTPKRYS